MAHNGTVIAIWACTSARAGTASLPTVLEAEVVAAVAALLGVVGAGV